MSRDPNLAEQLDALRTTLKSIDSSLLYSAEMTRLSFLYSHDEIKMLAMQCRKLHDADATAYKAVRQAQNALPEREKSRDEMVKINGKEETDRLYAPFDEATKMRAVAFREMAAFSDRHPLIEKLVRGHG